MDAPAAEVRRIVGHRAMALTGDDRRRAAPDPRRGAEGLMTVNAPLGTAGGATTFVLAVTAVNLAALGAALSRLSAPVTVAVPWRLVGGTAGACAVIAVAASMPPGAVWVRA